MILTISSIMFAMAAGIHPNFTYVKLAIPSLKESPRYFSEQNFMGKVMTGYECGH